MWWQKNKVMSKTTDHIIKERNENPIPFEDSYLKEIHDYYDMKNKVGDIMIEHQYEPNMKLSDTERLKEVISKIFSEIDKYREKHSKK